MSFDTTCYALEVRVIEILLTETGRIVRDQTGRLDGKSELEPVVDDDLNQFAKFYSEELANGNLSKFERAAIKTYLAWKLNVADGT